MTTPLTPDVTARLVTCECGTTVAYEGLRVHRRSQKHRIRLQQTPIRAQMDRLLRAALPPEGVDGGIVYANPHLPLSVVLDTLAPWIERIAEGKE